MSSSRRKGSEAAPESPSPEQKGYRVVDLSDPWSYGRLVGPDLPESRRILEAPAHPDPVRKKKPTPDWQKLAASLLAVGMALTITGVALASPVVLIAGLACLGVIALPVAVGGLLFGGGIWFGR